MDKQSKIPYCFIVFVLVNLIFCNGVLSVRAENEFISAVGDSGMRRDNLRVAIESWNQCNEVGEEALQTGSPRAADCFDIYKATPQPQGEFCFCNQQLPYVLVHRVTEQDNKLG
ncbi:uncharacterized protein Pyn_32105 [Prunus yedoensis var. nudiflora]|uniref:DUF7705 domain-containing protein n=1 Tax=Prunus yedoensis var. nudiflora TaxID=2094558 RepID=A0A314YLE8_PRUYE|nr:uncharacterized protein Pyn_32105 [Prunus yedoensis var. nudiflora]